VSKKRALRDCCLLAAVCYEIIDSAQLIVKASEGSGLLKTKDIVYYW
jgi:hypothetical protein